MKVKNMNYNFLGTTYCKKCMRRRIPVGEELCKRCSQNINKASLGGKDE